LLDVVRQEPQQYGHNCVRWTLSQIRQTCGWLHLHTDSGMHQLLERLGITYKWGRDYAHSPDLAYLAKAEHIRATLAQVRAEPDRYVLLYLDEMTFFRQPTLARAYEAQGHQQPLAHRACFERNTKSRLLGALDALTGKVLFRQRSHIDIPCLTGFWSDICQAYPQADTIYVVLDNWPVHFHPDVLAPLQPQDTPFPLNPLPNWPQQPRTSHLPDRAPLPIQLLPLPTYAPWLNPIEKLWRRLKQHVIHLHRLSHDWQALKSRVDHYLRQFADASPALLRYVGLLPS
jgi:hypothetical protein